MDQDQALSIFSEWYSSLKRYSVNFPARGTISGALIVLERLKENFVLDIDDHTARGGTQIRGASGASIKYILDEFGESRPFVSEGGRTNRGLRGDIDNLLKYIKSMNLDNMDTEQRNDLLSKFQKFLVERVADFHNQQRLNFYYDPAYSVWQNIHNFLLSANETNKMGQVAQYLVGAKLQLRFPDIPIENLSYSTSDIQLGRPGDFKVGDTAFHVTVSPLPAVYQKCGQNLRDGYRPFLLIPDRALIGTKQNAELENPGKIIVESIETFVSQNIEELSEFTENQMRKGLLRLLETYNQRVDSIEKDKSLLVEIPKNL